MRTYREFRKELFNPNRNLIKEKEITSSNEIEVGDLAADDSGHKGIIRHIGPLNGYGREDYVWSEWKGETTLPLTTDQLKPRSEGGILYYACLSDCKLIKKGGK